MKSKAIALLALVSLGALAFAGAAFAGINPANPGLPVVDTSLTGTDNNFYASLGAAIPANYGSVMCVACHTRNPAARTLYSTTKANWNYVGSHFVTRNFADTAKGGGYTDGTSPKNTRRTTNLYVADNNTNMTIANGWYGAPRYGKLTAGVIDSDFVADGGTAIGASAAQMICESCHSIVKNIGPAKLLATAFANGAATSGVGSDTKGTVSSTLCIGCHSRMTAGVSAEWQYQPVVTGVTWAGTQHHRNSLGTTGLGVYFGSGTPTASHDMGRLDPTYYTPAVQMWAAGPGLLPSGGRVIQWTGPRMLASITDNNQIMPTSSGSQLLCTNCHRGHNADTSAGATILMRGDLAISSSTLIGSNAVPTGASTAYTGVYRMEDAGGRSTMIKSTNAMCLACHR
jgi:hypothetical protein